VATASAEELSPKRGFSKLGAVTRTSSTCPAAWREVRAKGWKVVCFQASPPGAVMIGAMTLTSWASEAEATRSLWRSREISRLPKTTASIAL
jgi:hypothetical protein